MKNSKLLGLSALLAAALAAGIGTAPSSAAASPGNVYEALTSCRLVDTRDPNTVWMAPNSLRVDVKSHCGVPSSATAAAFTVTVTQTTAAGYLTALPAGAPLTAVSILNFEANQTLANGAIVQLSSTGAIDMYASVATNIIVDVSGYFRPSPNGRAAAGRFVAIEPARLLDSRSTGVPVGARSSITVALPSSIPKDTIALALTVTITDPEGPGYLTAYSAGSPIPLASNLNFDRPNQIRAAGFIATVSSAGVSFLSTARTNIIVDVSGYFTGRSAEVNTQGLFVPIEPRRMLDNRFTGRPLQAHSTVDIDFGPIAGVPMSAIAANWTLTQTTGIGYVSAFATGSGVPSTSTVNSDSAGQTIANFGIVKVGGTMVSALTSSTTHLVVDAYGWFTHSNRESTVIAAVGDMACAPGAAVSQFRCHHKAVSDRLVSDPLVTMLLALGDEQYDNGELAFFQTEYEATYGRLKSITKPAPGNHEYNSPGASGYYAYFGAAAGDPAKGYYSFNIGSDWHVISLNSNCSIVSCAAGSAQERWLDNDLATNARPCVLAYWHHPRFSSGDNHGEDTAVKPLWNTLYVHGTELVLSGHEHDYERFGPQRADGSADLASGIRQFVVGTGGRAAGGFNAPLPSSEMRLPGTFGYLRLTLGAGEYSWQFVTEAGSIADSGQSSCGPVN